MKTITIKQPWANALLAKLKDVENRRWRIPDGEYYIHVAKNPDKNWQQIAYDPEYAYILEAWLYANNNAGHIIGSMTIKGTNPKSLWAETTQIAHKVVSTKMFHEPIAALGQQGIWEHPIVDNHAET